MIKNHWLKLAATINFLIAALHIYIILAGASAYRFFGAGEQFAVLAEQGNWIPAMTTSLISLVFTLWGFYALSGAKVFRPMFLTRAALNTIGAIYVLRGGLPFLVAPFLALDQFMIISSGVCLLISLIHVLGLRQAQLEPDRIEVRNIHVRQLVANPNNGQLIDQLASSNDILWAHERWMPMEFLNGLQVGSRGGHGSIRYDIQSYTLGKAIQFRFTSPKGFDGWHKFTLESNNILKHEIVCQAIGTDILLWWLIRPIHDAVIEDCFDKAEAFAARSREVKPRQWSLWVRFLRKISPREPSPHQSLT